MFPTKDLRVVPSVRETRVLASCSITWVRRLIRYQVLRSPLLYSIFAMMTATMNIQASAEDSNTNGIDDSVEIALAAKFVPAMQLHPYGYENVYYPVYPVPVDILASPGGFCCPMFAGDLWVQYAPPNGQWTDWNPVTANFNPTLPFAHIGSTGGDPPLDPSRLPWKMRMA